MWIVSRCAAGHGKNVRGAIDQGRGQRLAAHPANVHALLLADLHRVRLGGWPRTACTPADATSMSFRLPSKRRKRPFRHRASADISCTNEEDVFHDSGGASERDSNLELNLPKSI